ncbi:HAAS signaling domain-containing protein [Actinomadura roseirufa]|uniref:HAAS signaling domain-containing protein n=1 Tax=Actinomadura roseirufa TaxID=2094049 RepID=UPI001041368E|nr:hypothetical protein [Actinomadura roseirufa]
MTETDELIEEYVGRLEAAARVLPADRRTELVEEIRDHIATVLAQSPDRDEAAVRTVLDRLGTPEEIVQEACVGLSEASPAREQPVTPGQAPPGARRAGGFAIVTVSLLLIGGVVLPGLGWLVGVMLLCASARWTLRDKLIGALVFPGGLGFPIFYLLFAKGGSGSSSGVAATLVLVVLAGSIGSAAYLLHRALRTAA